MPKLLFGWLSVGGGELLGSGLGLVEVARWLAGG